MSDTLQWQLSDLRPDTVAFAIMHSASVLPWSGTEMFEKLDDYLMHQVQQLRPKQLDYVRDLYHMFEDGFDLDYVKSTDPDAYDLHCSLCAYTLAAQANRLPI